jgi:predicted ABC-type transport system involved in lysophospholipase L1 biosynthesis ATPase subunit
VSTLESASSGRTAPSGRTPPRGSDAGELLRLRSVSKSYRRGSQELCVLREADLDVRVGQVVCVLAKQGAGTTTLLRIVAGIESVDSGDVSFEGQDLQALSHAERSRLRGERIAWVGKRGPRTGVQMFDYVCNPLLARAGRRAGKGTPIQRWRAQRAYLRTVDGRARAALERVGAAGCAKAHWGTMSDWERVMVEVAHAIAGEPTLLLVDDVADNLGPGETKAFIELLWAISKERQLAVLMSVSDGQAAVLSDRIMRLTGGRLEQGTQRPASQAPPPTAGNVLDFPEVASARLEAGHASIT